MPSENSENPVESNQPAEHGDSKATGHSQETETPAPPIVAPPTTQPCPKHTDITCNTKRDWIDKTTLGFEAFGLLVLIVYTIATIAIWRANKQSADAATRSTANADRSFRQDERAWMAFKFAEGSLTLTIGKPFLVPTELTNVGKTPAKNVRGNIVVGVFKKGESLDFTYTSGHANYGIRAGTMFPTGKIIESFEAIKHGKEHAEPIIFTPPLKDELFSAQSFLIVHGRIAYNDIFGTEHWTTYCRYVLHPELISEECTRYNDTDDNQ